MINLNLKDFKKGWVVGDFLPSLIKSKDIEVGLKKYKKGEKELKHIHKKITEYTIVISGVINMLNKKWLEGDIVIVDPMIVNEFECIEDAVLLVIKTPSIPDDKYVV